jgi:D-alanyl-lipoteichoic acid acyltransferase DltB (MBOAT superfamily)
MEAVQFTSFVFIVFLTIVFAAYWIARQPRSQNLILVLASYFFYGWWDYRFCSLILFSSLVDYWIGSKLRRTDSVVRRRVYLGLSLVSNLGLLAVFKYFGFFADSLQILAEHFGWSFHAVTLSIVLPVGISFYTFQTLSYTIDIYRRQLEPSNSLIDYLAFVSFFPQLVAGPIERGKNLLPQFQSRRMFDRQQAEDGCRLILWGFFKKLAIADPLSITVDRFYGSWETATGPELTMATVFFAFQIYCDFSAYSDIAIGTAKLFNIRLMRNFAYPYFSQSIGEFWRRWHISLSTWFRDYVYIPLGGSQVGPGRRNINLMATFLLSGLWHGAAWTFVAWGGIHGAALTGEKMAQRNRPSKPVDTIPGGPNLFPRPGVLLRMWFTFGLVCCGWVFFRADSIAAANHILSVMFTQDFVPAHLINLFELVDGDKKIKQSIFRLLAFILVEWLRRRSECPLASGRDVYTPLRWAAYTVLIWGSLDVVSEIREQPFVYFAF